MSKSVKVNFGYNLILTFCSYLFPLLTYPYVSRVLGVDKIGACNFVDGIINYYVLFSMLGIGSYGVREIARCKDDIFQINKVFTNLVSINIIGTILSIVVLFLTVVFVSSLQPYKGYLWIGAVKLFFNVFLIEWFFQGLQDFKYITIRSLIVKLLYVVSIFVFVQTKDDVEIYYGLTAFSVIINAAFNWFYSRKFRKFEFSSIDIKPFLVPVIVFGYYRILTSMYTTFNVVFLGFTSGDIEVGYFTTATKLYTIIMGVFTAFTTVMVPRVSELFANGEVERLQIIANQTFSMLTRLSMPIIFFSLFYAENIILLLSGPGYNGACIPFRIVIFLLLIIGAEQIVIQQFLMATHSNKGIFGVCTIGAIVGITLNICITPTLNSIGSAIAWGISECSVLITGIILVKKVIKISIPYYCIGKDVIFSAIYLIPLFLLSIFDINKYVSIFLAILSSIILFVFINIVLQPEPLLVDTLSGFKRKFISKR